MVVVDAEDFVHLQYPEYPSCYLDYNSSRQTKVGMCESSARRARAADLYPRIRTHYDESGLAVPFQPICGEFVQWVGRMSDSGVLAVSTYRLHAQARRGRGAGVSVPLRLVEVTEIRDMVHLVINCKDGKTLKCSFTSGDVCSEWARRIAGGTGPLSSLRDTFAAAYAAWARELPPASAQRSLLERTEPHAWFKKEVERLGFTERGAWRVTAANAEYKLCPSYPPLLVVPACVGDEDLDSVARFRAVRRLPAVVWRHKGNGAVLARSSQPEVGWLGWRSAEDERLLAALAAACALDRGLQPPATAKQPKLLIVDARSYASAVTNRARGGGCECAQYYPGADIQFMSLPNIHHVRKSFQQVRALAAETDAGGWHAALERSLWLHNVAGLGRAAALAARALLAGRPVLVHCSDGWDRTPQIISAAQLLLDPYYRTLEGFRVLVEREWLDFGHKFADRCGHSFGADEPNERAPIFLQWLDLVHQLTLQYPCHFEFSQAYLMKLVTHAHSCMFGTFLCNSARERADARVHEHTASVWRLLEGAAYRNHLYTQPAPDHVLWGEYDVRSLSLWSALYTWERDGEPDEPEAEPEPQAYRTPPTPRPEPPLARTRSCDDLIVAPGYTAATIRDTQRRSSDPNIGAPDILTDSVLEVLGEVARAARASSDATDATDGTTDGSDASDLPIHPARVARHGRENGNADLTSDESPEREPAPPDYAELLAAREEAAAESRVRHISIGWRSVSESSQQTDSSGVSRANGDAPSPTPVTPPLSTDSDECEERPPDVRRGTDHTLCPNSPAVRPAERCACEREARCCGPGRVRCVCGGGAALPARDPIDGLPTSHSVVQSRLHHIILEQKRTVERLSDQLRAARAALRRHAAPVHSRGIGRAPDRLDTDTEPEEAVEVGEEPEAEVVWLPDSAAPRCQHCSNQFWLARRRHHCRRCGGVFCGSCSDTGRGVRVCRACSDPR